MKLKKRFKSYLKSLGYDLVKLNGGLGAGTFENELLKILEEINIDLVLDIGANKGQFGSTLYNYGFNQNLLSFEPLSKVYDELKDKAKISSLWHVYERCCVGDVEKDTFINVSNLVGNSSVLSIKNSDYNVKQSHYIDKEAVKQINLSTLNANEHVQKAKNVFIKMDIQGYEHMVLKGLAEVDYNVVGFYLELSLVNLYDGQEDYLFICNTLKSLGYDLVYIAPESIRANRMIQFNGVFLHNSVSYT